MTTAIPLVTVVVRDYDEAIAFYVDAMGFRLNADKSLDDGKRWVVVAPPGDGASVLLAAIGSQTGGRDALPRGAEVGAVRHRRPVRGPLRQPLGPHPGGLTTRTGCSQHPIREPATPDSS